MRTFDVQRETIMLQSQAATGLPSVPMSIVSQTSTGLDLITNRTLTQSETGFSASIVCEPTVAVRDEEVFITGNSFASKLLKKHGPFQHVDIYKRFCPTPEGQFWTDPITIYDPAHDLFVWLLQYEKNAAQENTLRLAIATGDEFKKDVWHYYDLTPKLVGNWTNQFFDFPDLVVGKNYLYLSTSTAIEKPAAYEFQRAIMIRFRLQDLMHHKPAKFDYVELDETNENYFKLTQGATDTMYWGMLPSVDHIRVFSWPENKTEVTYEDIPVTPWLPIDENADIGNAGEWIRWNFSTLTAAWSTSKDVGFAWTVTKDAFHPYPYIRVAIIDKQKNVIEPDIWNDQYAFGWPATATNSNGDVGISLFYGGNKTDVSHAVGILVPDAVENRKWDLLRTIAGTHSSQHYWGDYISVQRHGTKSDTWVATGFTLQKGIDSKNIAVQYIHFKKKPVP